MVIPSVLSFFLWKGNWNAQKCMTSQKWLQNFMQPLIFGCGKRYDPQPICTNPPTQINDRSLNTPHQRHFSSYLLIPTFWGGVVKDREAPFSLNYARLKNFWGLMLLLVVLYLQVLWNLILVVILCKLDTRPQLSGFVYMNAIAFKCFLVRMIKNHFHSFS